MGCRAVQCQEWEGCRVAQCRGWEECLARWEAGCPGWGCRLEGWGWVALGLLWVGVCLLWVACHQWEEFRRWEAWASSRGRSDHKAAAVVTNKGVEVWRLEEGESVRA